MAWLNSATVASGPTDATLGVVAGKAVAPASGTIDGVSWSSFANGTRILLLNQGGSPGVAAVSNGLWLFQGTGVAMIRPADFASASNPDYEDVLRVANGTVFAHTEWALVTQGTITVDTTAIAFSRQFVRINVKNYGAAGNSNVVSDGAMTSGSATLVCSTSIPFVTTDVGKSIVVIGAGTSGAPLVATITGFGNASQIFLSTAAANTVSGSIVQYGTDDSQAIFNAYSSIISGVLVFPPGTYFIGATQTISIPASVELEFEQGSILAPSPPNQVTINGPVRAHPSQQIFGGLGSIGTVAHVAGTGPLITATGSPVAPVSVAVHVIVGGTLASNNVTFQYSINAGPFLPVPPHTTSGASPPYQYTIPGTGITIGFPAGTYTGTGTGQDQYFFLSSPAFAFGRFVADHLSIAWWGAKCDMKWAGVIAGLANYGAMSASSATLSLAVANPGDPTFASTDVGKSITVQGAGINGQDLHTTISTYVSSTQVTLATTATNGVSTAMVFWGTDDSSAWGNAAGAATGNTGVGIVHRQSGYRLFAPACSYVTTGPTIPSNVGIEFQDGALVHSETPMFIQGRVVAHREQWIFSALTPVLCIDANVSTDVSQNAVVYAAWWGARGDWVGGTLGSDNTWAFRNAIIAAASRNNGVPGGTVVIGAGAFRVTDVAITIDAGATSFAAGGSLPAATQWAPSTAYSGPVFTAYGAIVYPTAPGSPYYFGCVGNVAATKGVPSSGTSGATEPNWNNAMQVGSVIQDNNLLWINLGVRSPFNQLGMTIEGFGAGNNVGLNTQIICGWTEPTGTAASLSNAGALSGMTGASLTYADVGRWVLLQGSLKGPNLPGTFDVTNGQASVPVTAYQGGGIINSVVVFASQPGVPYTVTAQTWNWATSTGSITVSPTYSGTSNLNTTANATLNNGAWQIASVTSSTACTLVDPSGMYTVFTTDTNLTWTVCRRTAVRVWSADCRVKGLSVGNAGGAVYACFETAQAPAGNVINTNCTFERCFGGGSTSHPIVNGLCFGINPITPGQFPSNDGENHTFIDCAMISMAFSGFYDDNIGGENYDIAAYRVGASGAAIIALNPRCGWFQIGNTAHIYQPDFSYVTLNFFPCLQLNVYHLESEGSQRLIWQPNISGNGICYNFHGGRIGLNGIAADGKVAKIRGAVTLLLDGLRWDPNYIGNFSLEVGNSSAAEVTSLVATGSMFPNMNPFLTDLGSCKVSVTGCYGTTVGGAGAAFPLQDFDLANGGGGPTGVTTYRPIGQGVANSQQQIAYLDGGVYRSNNSNAAQTVYTITVPTAPPNPQTWSVRAKFIAKATTAPAGGAIGDSWIVVKQFDFTVSTAGAVTLLNTASGTTVVTPSQSTSMAACAASISITGAPSINLQVAPVGSAIVDIQCCDLRVDVN